MMLKEISIIIPAYNEEKRIKNTLNSLYKVFGDYIKILVISNGSIDNTINILKKENKKHPNLKFLDFPNKLGKGGAILEGLKIVNENYIGFIDADDAFDLEYIKKILNKLNDYDCIIASKWKGRNFFQIDEPFLRKILSRVWNLLAKIFLGLNYTDTQAGAKFFRKEAIDKIGFNFISKGFAFDIELLNKIKRKKFRIKEIYVPSKFIEGSTFSLKYCPYMLIDLIKIWLSR